MQLALFSIFLLNTMITGSVLVLESIRKLKNLILQFSRIWQVLEKQRFFKLVMGAFWIFVRGNSKIS